MEIKHKAGFVNIVGKPNAGKSTLINRLVGERLAIITSKAQTTRHRILGIVNDDNYQIIYSDTPGFIDPKYKLQESMMSFVNNSFKDADILIYLVDITDERENQILTDRVSKLSVPVVLVLNKIDKFSKDEMHKKLDYWKQQLPSAMILSGSALSGEGVQEIAQTIQKLLPENPPYYPKDQFTDKSDRFLVSEIVREKILLLYKEEIPYSVEIEVESFKEEEDIIRTEAIIYVNRKTHKPILIGKNGDKIKQLGIKAREELEKFYNKKIYLGLFVKIKENWRDDDYLLKTFGYIS